MNSQDVLNYTLSLGFLVLVGFISYAILEIGRTIRSIRSVIDDVREISDGMSKLYSTIEMIKDRLQINALDVGIKVLRMLLPDKRKEEGR